VLFQRSPATSLPTLKELVAFARDHDFQLPEALEGAPILAHCPVGTIEDKLGYETRAASTPWHAQIAISLAAVAGSIDPVLFSRAEVLYPVRKRLGRPFPDRIGMGRSSNADVCLRFASVSKYHAYISKTETGHVLHEARSRNGTFVDGKRLPAEGSAELRDGSRIGLGDELFLFFSVGGLTAIVTQLATSQTRLERGRQSGR